MITYCNLFNVGEMKLDRGAVHGGGMMAVNPMFTNIWSGDYTLADDSPLLGMASDGTAIGDPRWDPTATEVKAADDLVQVKDFKMNQNYPNPFNGTTMISFTLPNAGNVIIDIYNEMGQRVKTLINEYVSAGDHKIEFSANSVPTGIYFVNLRMEQYKERIKIIYLK